MHEIDELPRDQVRRLRRAEYDRLVALGAFGDDRLELLGGLLVWMSPQDPAHAATTAKLGKRLLRELGDRAEVRIRAPLALDDDSEPEPDLAVVAPGDYEDEHPATALLVVEVADSSLRKARLKARLYARARVREYWLVNLADDAVEVYSRPRRGAYASSVRHGRGATLRLAAFPDVTLRVEDILPRCR